MPLFTKFSSFTAFKFLVVACLLSMENSCYAAQFSPQDVRHPSHSASTSPRITFSHAESSRLSSYYSRELTPFQILLTIHNGHEQLKKCVFKEMNHRQKSELINQYSQTIGIIVATDRRGWTSLQNTQLNCYHMSLCLGVANVYGSARDNRMQFLYALGAYKFLISLADDITSAYLDGKPLRLSSTARTAINVMKRSLDHSRDKENELLDIIVNDQTLPYQKSKPLLNALGFDLVS